MYFDVAGIFVEPWIPPLVAFVISFFASMGGVSGAFLLLPFQMSFLSYTAPSVSATNQMFNIVAIPSGCIRYIREGRMLWPLTFLVVIGALPGVIIGAFLRMEYLPDPTNFKLFAGIFLLYIAVRMLKDIIRPNRTDSKKDDIKVKDTDSSGKFETKTIKFNIKIFEFEFLGKIYKISTLPVSMLSFVVGIAGGIYGVGGGAVMAPFFVSILGLPVYTIAGASLMGTLVTSVVGVIIYQVLSASYPGLSVAPDLTLGALFGIGGAIGMYLGARTQKFVPARVIKIILFSCISFVSIKYIINFFID